MTPLLNYHIDEERRLLWIIHRKVAGSSIREAIGCRVMIDLEKALTARHFHTITVVRHPWARVTSAAHNPYDDDRSFAQKIEEEILSKRSPVHVDWHFLPQWLPLAAFQVNRYILMENLTNEWPDLQRRYDYGELQHKNRGDAHDWREMDFDWSLLEPWYYRDFDINPDWERE